MREGTRQASSRRQVVRAGLRPSWKMGSSSWRSSAVRWLRPTARPSRLTQTSTAASGQCDERFFDDTLAGSGSDDRINSRICR